MGMTRHPVNPGGGSISGTIIPDTINSIGLIFRGLAGQIGHFIGIYDSNDVLISGAEADGDFFAPDIILRHGQPEEFRAADEIETLRTDAIVFNQTLVPLKTDAQMGQYYLSNGAPKLKVPEKFFLILGQSNAHGQGTIDPLLDIGDSDMFELSEGCKFISALDPLDNQTHTTNDKMGFGVAFGREYLSNNDGETTCLVLAAKSGTSFGAGHWQKGGEQYNDAVAAANKLIAMGSVLAGVLWHQGESDSTATSSSQYQARLIQFVSDLRADIEGDHSQTPFIAGTLADDFIAGNSAQQPTANRVEVNDAIKAVPTQIDYAATANLMSLATLDNIHFNAASLRIIGQRYYTALTSSDATSIKSPANAWSSLRAYLIDGSNEYFTGGNGSSYGLSNTVNFSIAMTVNMDMTRTASLYLLSLFDGTAVGKIELSWVNSAFRFQIGSARTQAQPTRADKNYHIVLVYDGSQGTNQTKAKIYVDGVNETNGESGTIPATTPSEVATTTFSVGARSNGSLPFDEKIGEVTIYNKSLTLTEVTNLYNSGSYSDPTLVSGSIASWWFGDNPGDDENNVIDNSGSSDLTCLNIEDTDITTL